MARLGTKNYNDKSNIVFSLAKCTGNCMWNCQEVNGNWQDPILNFSDCSSGCSCPPLEPLEQQCASNTVFNKACV